ncbi:sepL domain protein [Escherichia coli DEC11C]|nr:sepL domain protein [Escherichia coli DEC11C]
MANGIEFNQNTASVFNSNSLDFELESQQLTKKILLIVILHY